jgi:hypothetical protein
MVHQKTARGGKGPPLPGTPGIHESLHSGATGNPKSKITNSKSKIKNPP